GRHHAAVGRIENVEVTIGVMVDECAANVVADIGIAGFDYRHEVPTGRCARELYPSDAENEIEPAGTLPYSLNTNRWLRLGQATPPAVPACAASRRLLR